MRRLAGTALLLHGLAHAWPGSVIVAAGTSWILGSAGLGGSMVVRWPAALLWATALAGFLGAGFGLLGVPAFRAWRGLARTGAGASIALLLLFQVQAPMVAGVLIDGLILALVASRPRERRARPAVANVH